jgi:hypothetical protein
VPPAPVQSLQEYGFASRPASDYRPANRHSQIDSEQDMYRCQ